MPRFAVLLALLTVALGASAQTHDRTLSIAATAAGDGEARHALVIGNGAYTHGALKNPVNDARAMAKALAAAGFNVRLLENGSHAGMQRVIRQWGNDIAKGGIGLFYYAGHGMQVKGRNYLVPVNAEIEQEDEIEFGSLDVNLVLAKMDSAKNAVNIVILDACRNNPFARSFRVSASGLAQMDAPTGTFIAFATAPGSTASDGQSGENGTYTRHLVREMPIPGVPIEQVFKRVRNGVMADTKGLQVPWESSSLRGEFVFIPGKPGQDMVAEAIADAVRREREANQQRMDQVIREALERQRAQFEQEGIKLAAARPPDRPQTAGSPLPIVTASLAPGVTASAVARKQLPQTGDHWTYRLIETKYGARTQREYAVKVAAASNAGILDQLSLDGGQLVEWAHAKGGYLFAQGPSIYSPYLAAFEDLPSSGRLGKIEILERGCFGMHACDATARIVGRETVSVPAGRFSAVKVEVEHTWRPGAGSGSSSQVNQMAQMNGARTLTIWYAPDVKRAIKYSSRLMFGDVPPVDANFDLELVSYQLK